MRKIKQFVIRNLAFVIVFMLLVMPVVSFAVDPPLVPPCTPNCGFNDLLTLVNNVINFILKFMVIPIAAIMFAYAGFLLITAGGEAAHARTKAKEIFTNAIIGLIIAVAATLIVKMILSIAGYTGPSLLF